MDTLEAVPPAIPAEPPSLRTIIVRLADEGMPVRSIARSVQLPSEDIREVLHGAIDKGTILEMPREDWPANVSRDKRSPAPESIINHEVRFLFTAVRCFKVTRLQAAILAVLLKRNEVTREQLHQVIEASRSQTKDETDVKMVDVIICHLRKKLKPFKIKINTVWGCGYTLSTEHRDLALRLLEEYLAKLESAAAVYAAPPAVRVN